MTAETLLPQFLLAVFFVVSLYTILVRPQLQRSAHRAAFLAQIGPGQRVVLVGGIIARIVRLNDALAVVAVAEGVHVEVMRDAIENAAPVDGLPV
jgi:preprotein translocase subunit YajC